VGKTFSAMLALWEEFRAGRDVEWITPKRYMQTEGVIPDVVTLPDMKQRIDLLTRRLGLQTPLPPLDSTEFVAGHLKPNSTVYIEDPFGKTDDEFNISLHTYHFFDLQRFIAEISAGAARQGSRLLITSREALFERWASEMEEQGKALPQFALVQISANSYEYKQCLALAERLATSRGVAEPSKASRVIAEHSDVPFDTELILRDLPESASLAEVEISARKSRSGNLDKLRDRVIVEKDSERLFLLLLISLADSGRPKHNNFYEAYVSIFETLEMHGNATEAMVDAMEKYRSIFTRREIIVMEPWKKGGINLVGKNDATHYNLEPIHSTVVDVISNRLRALSQEWLGQVASALIRPVNGLTSRLAQSEIAYLLVRWGFGQSDDAVQRGIVEAVFGSDNLNIKTRLIFALWPSLPVAFKERFFHHLAEHDSVLAMYEACRLLDMLPTDDAWRVVRMLPDRPGLGVGLIYFGHPWTYVGEHLNELPSDIEDTLDRIAKERPVLFVFALSGVFIEKYSQLPDKWRIPFWDINVLKNEQARKNLFLHIADNWKTVPEELRTLFLKNATNENYRVRADVATAALVCHESAPDELAPVYNASVEDDEIYMPLHVMHDGLGNDEHDRRFAEAVYDRVGSAGAATILNYLIDARDEPTGWRLNLAERCVRKGGDFSRAALAYHCLDKSVSEYFGYALTTSPNNESEIVRLAWLWAYANSKKISSFSDDDVVPVLESLSDSYRHLALQYFSIQANYLPRPLDDYIKVLTAWTEADSRAVDKGLEDRQPPKGSRSLYGFPVVQFIRGD
jgi:hypothetical protein